jgi:DNA invertase Pin-like site-specific DNA recombinase
VTKAVRLPASTWHQDADNQVPDVEQFVAHHGYQVTAQYEVSESAWESGKDGGEYRRTLKQALDDAHAGKFEVLAAPVCAASLFR